MFTLDIRPDKAEHIRDALESVLANCDVHSDDAQELQYMADRLSFHLEKQADHASDVDLCAGDVACWELAR